MGEVEPQTATATTQGRAEFEKGSKIAFLAGLVLYVFSSEPVLSWKTLVFVVELLIIPGIVLLPVFKAIEALRGRQQEEAFNRKMALMFLPLVAFCIGAGYLTLRVHQLIFG